MFVGELPMVPVPDADRLIERVEELERFARGFDWRVHDLVVAPAIAIETPDQGAIRGSDRLEIHSSSGLR
ncbi:hypothetical protein [Actinoplanes sp. CA-252034]|uniref:hypothetical protein n=1 Tax=Actinoplanes sp. CA-252034 TaxID=3239906 RepID=UPI003D956EC5